MISRTTGIIITTIFLFAEYSFSQGIWGIEMAKEVSELHATVKIDVWRKAWVFNQNESIILDWGDGYQEELPLGNYGFFSSGLARLSYFSTHYYDQPGLYAISVKDSFLLADVLNIENSGNKGMVLTDSLNVRGPDVFSNWNEATTFVGYPDGDIIFLVDGVLNYPMSYQTDIVSGTEDLQETIVPFPAEGYSPPAYTNALYMDENVLVWDKPIEPGLYGVCIKVREVRLDYPMVEDSLLMSVTHRAFMIEIDSSMLVSTYTPFVEGILSVYPNPASEKLQIQWGGFTPGKGQFSLLDVHGREWHREAIGLGAAVQSLEVDVSDRPPGLYVLRMQVGDEVLSRKVVVER